MPGNRSLARLLDDHGDRWEIEKVEPGAEWVACQRDQAGRYNGGGVVIVSARDLAALRYHIEASEREDAGDHDDP